MSTFVNTQSFLAHLSHVCFTPLNIPSDVLLIHVTGDVLSVLYSLSWDSQLIICPLSLSAPAVSGEHSAYAVSG